MTTQELWTGLPNNQEPRSTSSLRICCLPVAGLKNPYQALMMKGLRANPRLNVHHGVSGKFLAALRTALRYRPDAIHYDWINRYFRRRRLEWTWLNAPFFVAELLVVRYVLGCKLVWTLHNIETHDASPSFVERWVRRRFAHMCEWIRVFQPSSVERAASFLGLPAERFIVVPEGSYVEAYQNKISREAARSKLEIAPSAFVLLYLGSMRPYKGVESLVKAFASVQAEQWTLIIAGCPATEEYLQSVRALAQRCSNVRLVPRFVEDSEIQYFYKACNVVVLPFEKIENSGSVVLAMSFARAVLAPRLGVIPERLRQQTELLYDPGHLEDALRKLQELPSNRLDAWGDANYEAVEQHQWKDFGDTFRSLIKQRR